MYRLHVSIIHQNWRDVNPPTSGSIYDVNTHGIAYTYPEITPQERTLVRPGSDTDPVREGYSPRGEEITHNGSNGMGKGLYSCEKYYKKSMRERVLWGSYIMAAPVYFSSTRGSIALCLVKTLGSVYPLGDFSMYDMR
jgi:hypothetical protein